MDKKPTSLFAITVCGGIGMGKTKLLNDIIVNYKTNQIKRIMNLQANITLADLAKAIGANSVALSVVCFRFLTN